MMNTRLSRGCVHWKDMHKTYDLSTESGICGFTKQRISSYGVKGYALAVGPEGSEKLSIPPFPETESLRTSLLPSVLRRSSHKKTALRRSFPMAGAKPRIQSCPAACTPGAGRLRRKEIPFPKGAIVSLHFRPVSKGRGSKMQRDGHGGGKVPPPLFQTFFASTTSLRIACSTQCSRSFVSTISKPAFSQIASICARLVT